MMTKRQTEKEGGLPMNNPQVNYHDKWIIPPLAAFVGLFMVVYGHRIPFGKLLQLKSFYEGAISSILCTFFVMLIVSRNVKMLDKQYAWRTQTWMRALRQLIDCFIVPALVSLAWTFLFFQYKGQPFHILRYFYEDFPFVMLLLLGLNTFYIRYYFKKTGAAAPLREAGHLPATVPEANPTANDAVAFYRSEGKINFIYWLDGSREVEPLSIRELMETLDGKQFCRVKRGLVVNREAIEAVVKDGRVYEIRLKPPFGEEECRTSRAEAKGFDAWFNQSLR